MIKYIDFLCNLLSFKNSILWQLKLCSYIVWKWDAGSVFPLFNSLLSCAPVRAFNDWVHHMCRASKLLIFRAGMPDGRLCGRCAVLRRFVLQQPPEAWQPQQQQQEQQHWEPEGRDDSVMMMMMAHRSAHGVGTRWAAGESEDIFLVMND